MQLLITLHSSIIIYVEQQYHNFTESPYPFVQVLSGLYERIMLEDNASLDGDYAAFGRVLKGLETVDSIGKVMVDKNDKPLKDITIKSVEFVRLNNE